ncbi:HutD/Ves family protein [Dyella psychrodurans]|uniref:HutD family protein n=1 Tax=Dyella psychrodurans TaxID=1927960 RepID=A0A370XAN9_9GAMM|nr:HutD family protein [Dyella psychrodurans]RDS85494.1 HutD family protein [Dyella psychrodurans]
MNALRLVDATSLRTQAWANGAGTTTVIASEPDDADWRWRLSIADIAQETAFSTFADTRRQFVPLDAPVQLRFNDARTTPLLRLSVTRFDGGDAPYALLPEGPTRAFNLMLRGSAEGELIARPLNGSMWLPLRAGWRWFVHVLGGHAEIQVNDEHLAVNAGANLWIDAQPGERVHIEGGGELVLVQLATGH